MLANSIFQDDKAILSLYDIISSGEQTFFIALAFSDVAFRCRLKQLENGHFQIEFDVPYGHNDKIEPDDFFAKPAVLAIPKPANVKGLPNFNLIIESTEVESVKFDMHAENMDIPTHVSVVVRGFKSLYEDKDRTKAKHTALFKYNPQIYLPSNKGIIYDITTNSNQNSPFKNAVALKIKQETFLFYFEEVSAGTGYFIIKSQGEVPFVNFLNLVNAIRAAYSLINGYYIADSVLYVSKKVSHNSTLALEYQSINKTINSGRPLLDYNLFSNIKKQDLLLTSTIFENLVRLLYESEELRRSCVLITQSACLDNVSNGCLASVAIETITGYFMDKSTAVQPRLFEEKKIIQHIKYELAKLVKGTKKYAQSIDVEIGKNVWEKFSSKLGKYNELPNAVKLSTPFEEANIQLYEEELACLNCRNLYLHGKEPKVKGELWNNLSTEEAYLLISNTLRMLAGMLLLKKAGFLGHVVDWGKSVILYDREKRNGHGIKKLTWIHRLISEGSDKEAQ